MGLVDCLRKREGEGSIKIISENDYKFELFKRYGNCSPIKPEDKHSVYGYISIGKMTRCLDEENGKFYEAVILTSTGKRWLAREIIFRSPIKRFFYNLLALM